jgi:ABC-type antimicrobial peptide transport system permease subunit
LSPNELPGGVAGVCGALAATRLIQSMLFQTTATDLPTFLFVPLLLAFGAVTASYRSARHAARTDPMIAMRGD